MAKSISRHSKIAKAINIIQGALINDKRCRDTWIAAMAMSFKDQAFRDKRKWNKAQLHDTANKAAEEFLVILCHNRPWR